MDDQVNPSDFNESPRGDVDAQTGAPAVDPAALGLMQDPSLSPAANIPTGFAAGFDDPFTDLEFFTRKEIMKMAYEAGIRFYQQVVIKDQKLNDVTKHAADIHRCLDHTVSNLALYLNDTHIAVAFVRCEAQLKLHEDPWVLSIMRERARNAAMQAAMGG